MLCRKNRLYNTIIFQSKDTTRKAVAAFLVNFRESTPDVE